MKDKSKQLIKALNDLEYQIKLVRELTIAESEEIKPKRNTEKQRRAQLRENFTREILTKR